MTTVPTGSENIPRGLVRKQVMRNRLLTVALVAAALLNAALVALIAAVLTQSPVAIVVVVVLIAAFVLVTWLQTSGYAKPAGCRPPQSPDEKRLLLKVESFAHRLNIEAPRLFISNEEAPNAWASGHGSKAIVVVTSALLAGLDEDEMEGIIAHELAHIANRDTRLAILSLALLNWARAVIGLVTAAAIIAWLWGKGFLGHTGRDATETLVVKGLGLLIVVGAALTFVAGQLWFFVCSLMRLGVGRQREWMADAIGAQLTGNPAAMASALAKMDGMPTKLTHGAWIAQELCIMGEPSRGWLADLLETHPRVSRRIAQLRALAEGRKPPERGLVWPALAAASMTIILFGMGILAATWRPAPNVESSVSAPGYSQQVTGGSLESSTLPISTPTADTPTPASSAPSPSPDTSSPPATKIPLTPLNPPPTVAPSPTPNAQPITVTINPSHWLATSSWNQLGPTYEGNPAIGGLGATHLHAFGNDFGTFDYEFFLNDAVGTTATVTARLSSNYPYYTAPADGFSDVSLIVNGVWYPARRVIPDNGSGTNYTWQIDPQALTTGRNTLSFAVAGDATYHHGVCIYYQAVVPNQSDNPIKVRISP